QRAIVEQYRIAYLGVVARQALRLAAVRSNPPHVQFVWRKAAHKIDVTAIRRPDVMMAVYPRLLNEDLFRIGAIAVANEGRVSGRELVIDDSLPVRGPRRMHRSFEERPGRSANRWHEPDIVGVLAGRIFLANPQPNMRAIGRESDSAHLFVSQFGKPPCRSVHKRPAPDLVDPGIECPIAVGEKDDELPVGREGGVGFRTWEISHPLDVGIGKRVLPELVGPLNEPDGACRSQENTRSRYHHPTRSLA